jgi:hypothetical protein
MEGPHNRRFYSEVSSSYSLAHLEKNSKAERRTTFAKAYGIKVKCYGEHVGGTHWGNHQF